MFVPWRIAVLGPRKLWILTDLTKHWGCLETARCTSEMKPLPSAISISWLIAKRCPIPKGCNPTTQRNCFLHHGLGKPGWSLPAQLSLHGYAKLVNVILHIPSLGSINILLAAQTPWERFWANSSLHCDFWKEVQIHLKCKWLFLRLGLQDSGLLCV